MSDIVYYRPPWICGKYNYHTQRLHFVGLNDIVVENEVDSVCQHIDRLST